MVLGDMDGDGHLDAVTKDQGTAVVRIFYGDGSGKSFVESSAGLPNSEVGDFSMAWHDVGDVDGNGNLDIVIVSGGDAVKNDLQVLVR